MQLVDREMGDGGCLTRKRGGLPDVASSQEKAVETDSESADTDTLRASHPTSLGRAPRRESRPSSAWVEFPANKAVASSCVGEGSESHPHGLPIRSEP